jgi:hypothetical protein
MDRLLIPGSALVFQAAAELVRSLLIVNVDNVVDEIIRIKSTRCSCLVGLADVRPAVRHIIVDWQCPLYCPEVRDVIAMFVINGTYPSRDEFLEYRSNQLEFYQDPTEYWNRTRQLVPTLNLNHLEKKYVARTNGCCSICQGEMDSKTQVFELPGCKHLFHADAKDCLGAGNSILTWLSNHRKCPNCNVEVNVPKPSDKRTHTPDESVTTRKRARTQ